MKIGLTTAWESPTGMVRIAQLAEDRGFESIWVGEHSHFPVDSRHPFTKRTPEFYRRVPDPYVVLAAIASTTKSIRLGTGISLPAEHNPLTLAKSLATLDQATDGRLEWRVGYGWNQLEMVNRRSVKPFRRSMTAFLVCERCGNPPDATRRSCDCRSWTLPEGLKIRTDAPLAPRRAHSVVASG